MSTTRGVLYVHAAPSALCPHIEWGVGGVFGTPVRLTGSPAGRARRLPDRVRLDRPRRHGGPPDQHAQGLAADPLRGDRRGQRGGRGPPLLLHPSLGVLHTQIGLHGDVVVPEERIKHAMVMAALGQQDLVDALDELLGKPWDAELEPFRYAGDGAPVRWLHKVV